MPVRGTVSYENSLNSLADQQFPRYSKTQWGGDYVKIVNAR